MIGELVSLCGGWWFVCFVLVVEEQQSTQKLDGDQHLLNLYLSSSHNCCWWKSHTFCLYVVFDWFCFFSEIFIKVAKNFKVDKQWLTEVQLRHLHSIAELQNFVFSDEYMFQRERSWPSGVAGGCSCGVLLHPCLRALWLAKWTSIDDCFAFTGNCWVGLFVLSSLWKVFFPFLDSKQRGLQAKQTSILVLASTGPHHLERLLID